ncbi:pyrimidine 5'-nucleotidase [Rhodospirillum rubrum]|uniref:pyrimidine 5'-nucleotidase n=1 Tax=Rhodospirillum rubrum TaxID=1085 RepID=UPI0019072811|nr:pyrimidine 5'-nucleotidase [Rhodospirillum rubrum]MBK1676224.1 pyrimidine 5'-nucleotidase [Rhodospirillum rubrum]
MEEKMARPAEGFETWLFDLDNTLYPASADLFAQIDLRMKAYIGRLLGLPPEEAFRLQKHYYHTYGTSLRGLMDEHAIDPADFLAFVHDIDHTVLAADPVLGALLARLPGRKIVFTNGSTRHALAVLDRLGITDHFEVIHDIAASGFIPKPQPACYDDLVARYGLDPATTIMVEDSHKNLQPAAALGMTTLLVRNTLHWAAVEEGGRPMAYCHHVTDDLRIWLADWLAHQTPHPEVCLD